MAQNSGTLVIAPVRPASDQDTYPTAVANELQGGYHTVATLTDRNAIPAERRTIGMMVWVQATDTSYRLKGGIANTNWVQLSEQPSTGGDAGSGGVFSLYSDPLYWMEM